MINTQMNHQHLQIFLNQVGGHSLLLKVEGSKNVLKPAKDKELKYIFFEQTLPCRFYEYIDQQRTDNVRKLSRFLPHFFGHQLIQTIHLEQITLDTQTKQKWIDQLMKKRFSANPEVYIQMEDLTSGIRFPCILDLKMGFTPLHEKDSEKYGKSTSSEVGFRVCGMNVIQIKQPIDHTIFKDKYWGRSLTTNRLRYCLAAFFYDNQSEQINITLIDNFIEQLKLLVEAITLNPEFRWTSSSLLLIYEGDAPEQNRLKLIDFANVQSLETPEEPDNQMIKAIQNLITALSQIIEIKTFNIDQATE